MKKGFQSTVKIKADFETFWLDVKNQELAVLCLFNPFRIQYIPLDKIDDMSLAVRYADENKKCATNIFLMMIVDGKKHRIQLLTKGSYNFIDMEKVGNAKVRETQKFIDQIVFLQDSNCIK